MRDPQQVRAEQVSWRQTSICDSKLCFGYDVKPKGPGVRRQDKSSTLKNQDESDGEHVLSTRGGSQSSERRELE